MTSPQTTSSLVGAGVVGPLALGIAAVSLACSGDSEDSAPEELRACLAAADRAHPPGGRAEARLALLEACVSRYRVVDVDPRGVGDSATTPLVPVPQTPVEARLSSAERRIGALESMLEKGEIQPVELTEASEWTAVISAGESPTPPTAPGGVNARSTSRELTAAASSRSRSRARTPNPSGLIVSIDGDMQVLHDGQPVQAAQRIEVGQSSGLVELRAGGGSGRGPWSVKIRYWLRRGRVRLGLVSQPWSIVRDDAGLEIGLTPVILKSAAAAGVPLDLITRESHHVRVELAFGP